MNPTKGIEIASTATGAVLVVHVFGSPLAVGLRLDAAAAAVRANDLHFWPYWGLDGPYGDIVEPSVEAYGMAFKSARSAHAELSNAFSIFYETGVLLGQNAAGQASEDFRLWNTDATRRMGTRRSVPRHRRSWPPAAKRGPTGAEGAQGA